MRVAAVFIVCGILSRDILFLFQIVARQTAEWSSLRLKLVGHMSGNEYVCHLTELSRDKSKCRTTILFTKRIVALQKSCFGSFGEFRLSVQVLDLFLSPELIWKWPRLCVFWSSCGSRELGCLQMLLSVWLMNDDLASPRNFRQQLPPSPYIPKFKKGKKKLSPSQCKFCF